MPGAQPAPSPAATPRTTSDRPVLTPAEIDELVRAHMPLVGHAVREMMGRVPGHVSREDLTAAGLLALVQVVQGYDPTRGVPLARFASPRIRGAIIDELRTVDWASRSVRRRQRELDEVRGRLCSVLGRVPDNAEVAEAMGLSVAELTTHSDDVARASVVSLQGFGDTPVDEMLPASSPDPADVLAHRERVAYLHDAVELLPERLHAVVAGYFFDERPMAELAAELGVTESRISQMRAEALALLHEALHSTLEREGREQPVATGVAERRRAAYVTRVAEHRSFTARLDFVARTEVSLPA
ncbi:MAG: sigma-70 family RNA polymerase sigma factor [Nocardioidaceae bacterium]